MVATMITAVAHKEAAKQAILKQLRETGATSAQMPGSVEADSDDAKAALAELLSSGSVGEARPGLYYLDESKAKVAKPGNSFMALLAILIAISFTASLIALAVRTG